MGYVRIDKDSRVTAHSCECIEELDVTLEVDNEEVIDTYSDLTCGWAMTDFVYQDGHIIYDPPREKVNAERLEVLRKSLSDTDYFASQALEGLFEAIGEIEPADIFATLKILKAIVAWNVAILSKYSRMILQRKSWREEIQRIEREEEE